MPSRAGVVFIPDGRRRDQGGHRFDPSCSIEASNAVHEAIAAVFHDAIDLALANEPMWGKSVSTMPPPLIFEGMVEHVRDVLNRTIDSKVYELTVAWSIERELKK